MPQRNNPAQFKIIIMILLCALFFNITNLPAKAMKVAKRPVISGEILRYSIEEKGKKTGDFYIISIISPDNKKVTSYMNLIKSGSKAVIPAHYTNFHARRITSLETGSVLYYYENYLTNLIMDGEKGTAIMELKVNEKTLESDFIEKDWDGFKIKTMTSRLKIKQGYPIGSWNSVLSFDLRYLDASEPGDICMIVPNWIKTPFIGRFVYLGREKIGTRAGSFDTIKLGWAMGNVFLAALMQIFYKDYFFRVDEKTGVIVKETGENNYLAVIEERGVWKD